jgi:putative ABC transport system ATP-binding protein
VSAQTEALVHCRGLTRTYGTGRGAVHALRGLDLDVGRGELVALIGASGSGKSTLLHLLGAMDRPSSGLVQVGGADLGTLDDAQAARFRRERLGFVFQFFNLVPTLSALDNVALPARLAGVGAAASRERAQALLERVGLGERPDARPEELSGGQQQRVAIARALANEPALLLADEPTGNLDRATGAAVLDLLQELVRERSLTLIMATHADDAVERASRTLRIEDGRLP